MISAIILAAGRSLRMGQPKMLLPWGETTVLGKVITTVQCAGIGRVIVITGGAREQVERIAQAHHADFVHNDDFERRDMLSSIQCGIRVQEPGIQAILVCLGDQPQVEEGIVQDLCEAFKKNRSDLVVPSYKMRRGHPWLVARRYWDELMTLRAPLSSRDFLNEHNHEIEYLNVDTPSVITDLDTPEDYLKYRP